MKHCYLQASLNWICIIKIQRFNYIFKIVNITKNASTLRTEAVTFFPICHSGISTPSITSRLCNQWVNVSGITHLLQLMKHISKVCIAEYKSRNHFIVRIIVYFFFPISILILRIKIASDIQKLLINSFENVAIWNI